LERWKKIIRKYIKYLQFWVILTHFRGQSSKMNVPVPKYDVARVLLRHNCYTGSGSTNGSGRYGQVCSYAIYPVTGYNILIVAVTISAVYIDLTVIDGDFYI